LPSKLKTQEKTNAKAIIGKDKLRNTLLAIETPPNQILIQSKYNGIGKIIHGTFFLILFLTD
jgi:hypothetical protein